MRAFSSNSFMGGHARAAAATSAFSQFNSALGAHLLEAWDAALGVSLVSGAVDTWTGQKLGIVLTKVTTRPVISNSDANFNSKPSITMATTGDQYVKTAAPLGSPLYASASHPYGFAILRALNTTMAFQTVMTASNNLNGHQNFLLDANTTNWVGGIRNNANGQDVGSSVVLNTTACLIEWFWRAADNKCYISKNAGTLNAGGVIAGGTDVCDLVAIGGFWDGGGGTQGADAAIAFAGFCDTELSSGDRSSVHTLSQSIFGVP